MAAGLGLWVVMPKSAIMPDVNYYTAVISACVKQQTADLPKTSFLQSAISACEKGLQWQQAL